MHTTLCIALYRVLSDAVQTRVSTQIIDLKPIYSGVRTLKRYSAGSHYRECSAGRPFVRIYVFLTSPHRRLNYGKSNLVISTWTFYFVTTVAKFNYFAVTVVPFFNEFIHFIHVVRFAIKMETYTPK